MANDVVVKENKEVGTTTYTANGEEVKLSIPMIKKYLVSGGGQISDQEAVMFLSLCKYQHLNPFLKEAYCIKYGNKDAATLVTSKQAFEKRADACKDYRGKKAGIIVQKKDGSVEEREGTFYLPDEKIVGGWAKIFIEGKEPEYVSVSFDEYAAKKSDGSLNRTWAQKPATMIRKVAEVQALREAFPNELQGMYIREEMDSSIQTDIKAEVAEDITINANKVEFEEIPEEPAEEVVQEEETEIEDFEPIEDVNTDGVPFK